MYLTKKKVFGLIATSLFMALACAMTVLAAQEGEAEYVPAMYSTF